MFFSALFKRNVLSAFIAALCAIAAFPNSSLACSGQATPDVDGTLLVTQADDFLAPPQIRYAVIVNGADGAPKKIDIETPQDSSLIPPGLVTGLQVRLHGEQENIAAESLPGEPPAEPVTKFYLNPSPSASKTGKPIEILPNQSAAVMAAAEVAQASTPRKLLVVLVDFPNSAVGCSVGQMDGVAYTNAESITSAYYRSSYGQVNTLRDGNGDGQPDVYRVTLSYDMGTCSEYTWMNDANTALTQRGINPNSWDRRVYYMGSANPCGWAGEGTVGGGSYSWSIVMGAYCGYVDIASHELGHNEGMWHAGVDSDNNGQDGGQGGEYGDLSDIMGYGGVGVRHFNAIHKIQVGWMPAANVVTPATNQTLTLTGLELNTNATQVIKIPRAATGGGFYYLSYRTDDGVFTGLPAQYKYVTNVHWWGGSSNSLFITTLADGQSFSDPVSGVTFTQNSHTATAANVSISNLGADTQAPTAGLASAPSVTTAGGTTYSFAVTYQDNTSVKVSTIGTGDIVVSKSGFSQTATFVNVNVNSDGTPRTATYAITPPGGNWDTSDNGTYSFALQASQVTDTTGNFAAAANLGSFQVNIPAVSDTDGDGIPDSSDNCPTVSNPTQTNTDGDSMGDACDPDDDNDGVPDASDCSPLIASLWRNTAYPDPDGDGIRNSTSLSTTVCYGVSVPAGFTLSTNGPDNCPAVSNPDQTDSDHDGIGNVCDTDNDNDGTPDASDCSPLNAGVWRDKAYSDPDGDGVRNSTNLVSTSCFGAVVPAGFTLNTNGPDNCPSVSNPAQTDSNGDGVGDACQSVPDSDRDKDGIPNTDDCAPDDATRWRHLAYPDADQDGITEGAALVEAGCFGATPPGGFLLTPTGVDNCPTVANAGQEDSDGNGIGDACDTPIRRAALAPLDFDGDGISDMVVRGSVPGNPLASQYEIHYSSNGSTAVIPFGSLLTVAAPADYTGDGLADLAEVQPSAGGLLWRIHDTARNTVQEISFGLDTASIMTGCDFSGDGVADAAVIQGGKLYYRDSSNGQTVVPGYAISPTTLASSLSCADVTGDHRAEILSLWSKPGKKQAATRFTAKNAQLVVSDVSGATLISFSAKNARTTVAVDTDRNGVLEPGALFGSGKKQTAKIYAAFRKKAKSISLASMSGALSPVKLAQTGNAAPECLMFARSTGEIVALDTANPKAVMTMSPAGIAGQLVPTTGFSPGL